MTKPKVKKQKGLTVAEAKAECARLGLQVAKEYDKRFKNTWLYTLNPNSGIKPVLRTSIVHKPKPAKKALSWADLQAAAANL